MVQTGTKCPHVLRDSATGRRQVGQRKKSTWDIWGRDVVAADSKQKGTTIIVCAVRTTARQGGKEDEVSRSPHPARQPTVVLYA